MRKIVINGDYLTFKTFAGACRFASEILDELDLLVEGEDIELLVPQYAKSVPKFKNIKIVKQGNQSIQVWRNFYLPRYVKKNNALLVDLTQAFPLGANGITCFFDCIPEIVENSYSGFIGKYIRKPLKLAQRKLAAKRSRAILTISECSKNDIVRIYGVPAEKVKIAYCGWQHINEIEKSTGILEKYPRLKDNEFYFCLGSRVPHKNIQWIVAAAQQNKNSLFVVSGENSYSKNFNTEEFPQNIIFTGYISDGDIKTLMGKCKAFILPSFYEGFGIPPLEALSQGAQAIIADASCFPEIYGNAVHYINPNNYKNIDIAQILKSPAESPMAILEKYSWKESAKALYTLINRVEEKI